MTPPPAELFASRVLLGPALRVQSDARLVDLVRSGHASAFEEIVRRYRRPLDRFAGSIVGARSEDVLQDAFSKALQALRRSETAIELRPWLYRIVRNTALNDLRDRGPAVEQLAETLPGGRGADTEAERREELSELIRGLQALPEPQRAAIVMRELGGHGHEEIAAALGLSGGAARQAIHRARAALRRGLGLLVPMPLLRALVAYAGEAGGASGAGASAGAGIAGAAGGGAAALKVGLATVLVVGSVGAGAAIERGGTQGHAGPVAAKAAAPTERGPGPRELRASRPAAPLLTAAFERSDSSGEGDEDRGRDEDDTEARVDGASNDGSGSRHERTHEESSLGDSGRSEGSGEGGGGRSDDGRSGGGDGGGSEERGGGRASGSGTSGDSGGTSGEGGSEPAYPTPVVEADASSGPGSGSEDLSSDGEESLSSGSGSSGSGGGGDS